MIGTHRHLGCQVQHHPHDQIAHLQRIRRWFLERPVNQKIYTKWRNFWIRGVFRSQHLGCWVPTVQPKHVSNPDSVIKKFNPILFMIDLSSGLCGEVDKSKPPVGALALGHLVQQNPAEFLWIADLLMDQFVMWNRKSSLRGRNCLLFERSQRSAV